MPTPEYSAHQGRGGQFLCLQIWPWVGPVSETLRLPPPTPQPSLSLETVHRHLPHEGPTLHFGNVLIFHRAALAFKLLSLACVCFCAVKRCIGKTPFFKRLRMGVGVPVPGRDMQLDQQYPTQGDSTLRPLPRALVKTCQAVGFPAVIS